MAYSFVNSKGTKYYLHNKKTMRGTKEVTLFYFAKDVRPADALEAVPAAYQVVEMKTGMPVLKKKV
jgi:hypothetical protein